MSQLAKLAIAGLLAALTAACGSPAGDSAGEAGTGSAETAQTPGAETGETAAAPQVAEALPSADFDSPTVPGRAKDVPGVSQLIAPTDLNARTRQAEAEAAKNRQGNRRDPFAVPLQVRPNVSIDPNRQQQQQQTTRSDIAIPGAGFRRALVPDGDVEGRDFRGFPPPALGNPARPRPATPPAARGSSNQAGRSGGTGTGQTTGNNGPVAADLNTPPQPVTPQPTEAQAIRVTGIAQVGSSYRVIVEVPGETARYVSVGDRIAGGQVLVKRVDFDRLLDPVVILEQFGQEVAKAVGEAAPTQQQATLPAVESPERARTS
ncbi:MAG: hypothetical protein Fur0042_14820 [Cyanophyceae cyanobacterium]